MKKKNIELIITTVFIRVIIKVGRLIKERLLNIEDVLSATIKVAKHRRGVTVAHQSSKLG